MSSNQDFVDKLFNTSYKLAQKGIQIADDTTHSVLKTVGNLKDTVLDSQNLNQDIFGQETGRSSSIFGSLLPGHNSLQSVKDNWMYGLTISATTFLIFWKCKSLMTFPDHLPQNESKCVLILGDMNDPIVRSQVMDLYRRRFTVFVCSENAQNFKKFEEETDFIYSINPSSADDLAKFTNFLRKVSDLPRKLASILFMPNLAYQPSGELSTEALEHEIRSNILVNYSTLIKLLPYLPDPQTQLILFNPSLTYNLQTAHHPTELFISGFIFSIFRSLKQYKSLNVVMVNLGLLQVSGQLSNYKFMSLSGSNISTSLHNPVYKLIMSFNGNSLQRFVKYITTFGGNFQTYYFGKYSWISESPFFPLFLNIQKYSSKYFDTMMRFFSQNLKQVF